MKQAIQNENSNGSISDLKLAIAIERYRCQEKANEVKVSQKALQAGTEEINASKELISPLNNSEEKVILQKKVAELTQATLARQEVVNIQNKICAEVEQMKACLEKVEKLKKQQKEAEKKAEEAKQKAHMNTNIDEQAPDILPIQQAQSVYTPHAQNNTDNNDSSPSLNRSSSNKRRMGI